MLTSLVNVGDAGWTLMGRRPRETSSWSPILYDSVVVPSADLSWVRSARRDLEMTAYAGSVVAARPRLSPTIGVAA